ncbi:MAG: hypothetical protein CME26_05430 [Gemmatimonadetes bacterium]|nr:hypothetical protein [Gemmatimonadota bacterium]
MAREIVALSPDSLEIREVEDPVVDDGQVLIRSQQAAAKHGTETASVKGYGDRGRGGGGDGIFGWRSCHRTQPIPRSDCQRRGSLLEVTEEYALAIRSLSGPR